MYLSPKRLRRGSKVAIVSPASPFKTDELIAGLDIIKAAGLEPVFGSNVSSLHSIEEQAASAIDRAEELMWAFTAPGIDAVITALGGLGSAETLPYLNFGAIRSSRRCLLGLSDITALNNGLLAGAGLISINGQYPSIRIHEGEYLREMDSESMKLSLDMMMSEDEWGHELFDQNNLYMPRTVNPGRARGIAIGGNLETLCMLLGTPFMPDPTGAILFIEDTHKDGETLSRMMIHLKIAGVLDAVAGVVIGEFAEVPEKMEDKVPSIEDVIIRYFGHGGPPCSYGYSFSHGPLTVPIPIGAMCEMDADRGTVGFKFTMAP